MGFGKVIKGALSAIPGVSQITGALDIIGGIADVVGGETGDKIKKGTDQIKEGLQEADKKKLSPDQQVKLKDMGYQHVQQMEKLRMEDIEGARAFSSQENKVEDQYIARTRPMVVRMFAVMTVVFVFAFLLLVAGVLIFSNELTTPQVDLMGSAMSYLGGLVISLMFLVYRTYSTKRSTDKAMAQGIMPEGLLDKLLRVTGKK